MAKGRETAPVATEVAPKKNPGWTNFEKAGGGSDGKGKRKAAKAGKAAPANAAPTATPAAGRCRRWPQIAQRPLFLVRRHFGDVAHLAAGSRRTLAVKVHGGARNRQPLLIVERSGEPNHFFEVSADGEASHSMHELERPITPAQEAHNDRVAT